jgi:hypothetical protein
MLHKLPEGFIVTSDEIPHKGDIVFETLNKVLFTVLEENDYSNSSFKKVIAQQDQIDFSTLLEEEQKKIGWFDIEKLAETGADNYVLGFAADYQNELETGYYAGYLEAFQKAQEFLSDKVFTLNEVKGLLFQVGNAMRYKGVNYASYYNYKNVKEEVDKVLQSLSQNLWQVELEMEWIIEGDEEHDEGGTLPGIVASYQQPKLTNGKITITKIL